MLTEKQGEAAVPELARWAGKVARAADEAVEASVNYDADSSSYVMRLAKRTRVLLFRLSEAQVGTTGREGECERTLRRKIKDLSS